MVKIEKAEALVESILTEKDFSKGKALGKKLGELGPEVVDIIINKLSLVRKEGVRLSGGLYHLLCVATELAEEKHAEKLANILLWEEVLLDSDRSNRGHILEALRRIGNSSIVPILEKYAEAVKQVKYLDWLGKGLSSKELHRLDRKEVTQLISRCL